MDRISTLSKAPDLFGAGKHGFRDGNLGLGIAPTAFNAEWFNGMQEELVAGLVENAGLVPAALTRTQVRQAIEIMIRKAAGSVAVAAGTADALTGDFSQDVTALVNGMAVRVKAAFANVTTTPTFQADATAAKTIVKGANVALVPGDIAGAGHWLDLQYDQALDKWVLLNPSLGVNALGVGQTWQSVVGSRAFSTTYTNTTGRPIEVYVAGTNTVASSSSAISIAVGGITVTGLTVVASGGIGSQELSARCIVPPGATYVAAGTQIALSRWLELR